MRMSDRRAPTINEWLTTARVKVEPKNPKAGELILAKILGIEPGRIGLIDGEKLTVRQLRKCQNHLGRLLAGRPLAQVLGYSDFYNVKLKINNNVLSPRAETEQIVEFCINTLPEGATLVDIGTGSGAIGLSVLKTRGDLQVVLTDVSKSALRLAKHNARYNKLVAQEQNGSINKDILFIQSNLTKNIAPSILQSNNVYFAANLPYVDKSWSEVKHRDLEHEPELALYANRNGLQIIFNLISELDSLQKQKLSRSTGWLILEHDPRQNKDLGQYCDAKGLRHEKNGDYVTVIYFNS